MPQVGFEPTIPVFERAKTVHSLDCAAAVIGIKCLFILHFYIQEIGKFYISKELYGLQQYQYAYY
jgi:hypothetical protein